MQNLVEGLLANEGEDIPHIASTLLPQSWKEWKGYLRYSSRSSMKMAVENPHKGPLSENGAGLSQSDTPPASMSNNGPPLLALVSDDPSPSESVAHSKGHRAPASYDVLSRLAYLDNPVHSKTLLQAGKGQPGPSPMPDLKALTQA